MNALRNAPVLGAFATAIAVVLLLGLPPAPAAAQSHAQQKDSFAQSLVNATLARHPGIREIGIAALTLNGCEVIASTDPGDIGERCERSDSQPMHTHKPVIDHENGNVSVTLPLRTAKGSQVGTVSIEFPAAGRNKRQVIERARKIDAEMEQKIHSKKQLLGIAF